MILSINFLTRLRSANYTLKRNIAFLFAYESVENLPKTNNGLEGEFAHLKTKEEFIVD